MSTEGRLLEEAGQQQGGHGLDGGGRDGGASEGGRQGLSGREASAREGGRQGLPSRERGRAESTYAVGLLGHGTVGSAFAELLEQRSAAIASSTGRHPSIAGVLTRDSGSFEQILQSSEAIVELMGGIEPARRCLLAAMEAGRHVVTANKQLLCEHGQELFDVAARCGVRLRFEAAIAGVIPVVRVLTESLQGLEVTRIHGIVNGTTNFILTEMERGSTYEQALVKAKRAGFAEADPSEDVSGRDAAAKMAILARLAFGVEVKLKDVRYEGIEQLKVDDLEYARQLGLSLKLVGTAERMSDGVSVRVHPAFLYGGHPLASVNGSFNAVTIEGESITEITMSGPGAGGRATASAVLGDLVSVMEGSGPPARIRPPTSLPLLDDVRSAFYLHVEVADRPGVLVSVAEALCRWGASIKSVLQRGLGENARLVMVTHPLSEANMRAAVSEIAQLELVRCPPRAITVIEEEFT